MFSSDFELYDFMFFLVVVSRIVARSEKRDMLMHLDVNSEIYPIDKGEKFIMALAPSLSLKTKVQTLCV